MDTWACPVERTLSVIEGKWAILILRDLFTGTKRFGELRSSLIGISPKTLTERLRALEQQGIVERKIYPEVPPRVEYSLTERGQTLEPIIEAMREWGASLSVECAPVATALKDLSRS
ncbi:MAG: helix-turn-helix transcriptional regulator [Chloroflexi bacterium]|nr:helix-turn-helix transcriptional regulator [Chloroflexota bacterium]